MLLLHQPGPKFRITEIGCSFASRPPGHHEALAPLVNVEAHQVLVKPVSNSALGVLRSVDRPVRADVYGHEAAALSP